MLQTRPVITKTISTAIIIGTGDVVSQLFDHFKNAEQKDGGQPDDSTSTRQQFKWDRMRTAKMCSWGCIIGPAMHGWYLLLERMFPAAVSAAAGAVSRRQQVRQAVKKLTVDQVGFAPVSIAVFLTYMGAIENRDWQTETKPKIAKEWLPTLLMNYTIWPLVQLFNFSIVPLHHQVNVVNVVAVFWNAYLSKVQHRDIDTKTDEDIHAEALPAPSLKDATVVVADTYSPRQREEQEEKSE